MDDQAKERLVPRRPLLPAFILLLLREAPSHGYEMCERLRDVGFAFPDPSPVYRELRTLEKFGLVRSLLSPHESGPVPKVYELTADGKEALAYSAAEASSVAGLLAQFEQRYRTGSHHRH
ncbi:MAG: PadR family transcriptional regulator [Acidimicrobiales bacterium]